MNEKFEVMTVKMADGSEFMTINPKVIAAMKEFAEEKQVLAKERDLWKLKYETLRDTLEERLGK